jgi:hypothetical protein
MGREVLGGAGGHNDLGYCSIVSMGSAGAGGPRPAASVLKLPTRVPRLTAPSMYSTCIFCRTGLGMNEAIEHFPLGRRLAFDAAKGRLWVICGGCGRWNLSPIEERWEAIEECERTFRDTRLRVTTGNIGLARLHGGMELVRIGEPMRPEFAAWRYGSRFASRRSSTTLAAGIGAAATVTGAFALAPAALALAPALLPAFAFGSMSIVVAPVLTSVIGMVPMMGVLAARDYVLHERVVARVAKGRRVLTVRARHVRDADFQMTRDEPSVHLPHDDGWVEFDGTEAMHVASVILAGANRFGAGSSQVTQAVRRIEDAGDASSYLRAASRMGEWRGGRVVSVLNRVRRLGTLHLSTTECLALEMAVHEESERRALEGELSILEEAWREAEQIAAIADDLLLPPGFDDFRGRNRDEY